MMDAVDQEGLVRPMQHYTNGFCRQTRGASIPMFLNYTIASVASSYNHPVEE